MHRVRESTQVSDWNDEGDGYSQEIDLATMFANAVADYKSNHEIPAHALRSATRLSSAYDILRNYGAIVGGRSTKRLLAEKDDAIRELKSRLAECEGRKTS